MTDTRNEISILVVPEGGYPVRKTIPNTLEAKQEEVGGFIEPFGLKDGATIYCNDEGKLGPWNLNRAILASDISDEEEGRIVEMMAGTFIITGFDYETGEDMSLTDEQADYWEHRFHNPEILVSDGEGGGVVLPIVLA